jgi:hypothetical protein
MHCEGGADIIPLAVRQLNTQLRSSGQTGLTWSQEAIDEDRGCAWVHRTWILYALAPTLCSLRL